MKKVIFIAGLLITIIGYTLFSCKDNNLVPEKAIAQTLLKQVDSFAFCKNKLLTAIEGGAASEAELQQLFLQLRLSYKKIEWATEYFSPATSRFVNGPPVEEIEMQGNQVSEPAGLQVAESFLFPEYDVSKKMELIQQLKNLQPACEQYKSYFANIDIFDWQVFDAAKLEVFRILTLGITGFDNPLTQQSMAESAASLKSLKHVLLYYTTAKADTGYLIIKFDAAMQYLKKNTDFNSFDRAAFITEFGNPITIALSNLEQKLKIHVIKYNRLLNQDAKTLFDTNAFNVNAYAPDQSAFITQEKVALGKILFADPILSGNQKRSCQSCHQPAKAFADGLVKNSIISSNRLLRRNTPTLLNSALQPSLFYDLKVNTLEDQSLSVMQNKDEMHGSLKVSVGRLWKNKTYQKMFSNAFPKPNRSSIDTIEVINALGSYVRSLVKLNSRFDEYMRGNKASMNTEELNGFNLFMGKAKCATCHYMPLFNGTFPPRFIKIETEVIGVPLAREKKIIDGDMGRFELIKIASLKHSFKTTTIRNAARTAPYMHNGVFSTLEQVVDFYSKGGGAGLGIQTGNQTLPFDKLNLTKKESKEIISFIKSLNSQ